MQRKTREKQPLGISLSTPRERAIGEKNKIELHCLSGEDSNRARLPVGGRKKASEEPEINMREWVISKRARHETVSRKMIREMAKQMYAIMSDSSNRRGRGGGEETQQRAQTQGSQRNWATVVRRLCKTVEKLQKKVWVIKHPHPPRVRRPSYQTVALQEKHGLHKFTNLMQTLQTTKHPFNTSLPSGMCHLKIITLRKGLRFILWNSKSLADFPPQRAHLLCRPLREMGGGVNDLHCCATTAGEF